MADARMYRALRTGNLFAIQNYPGAHRVLYLAAEKGDSAVVQTVLAADPDLINTPNERMHNSTALMAACLNTYEHLATVRVLLRHGADTTLHSDANRAGWGNTAFHWAVWRGAEGPLDLLLRENPDGHNLLNAEGLTPLQSLRSLPSTTSFDRGIRNNLQRLDRGCLDARRARIERLLQ